MSKTQAGARISPGAVWLLYAEAGLVFALFLFASIVSFSGLYSIASWVGLPPILYWALPLAIDIGIITYKVAEVILRYDDRKASKVKKAVFGTILFTVVSSAGNIVHVAALADPDPLRYWGGIALAALMPWAVYLSASVLADLIVKPYRAPAQASPVAEPATVVPGEAADASSCAAEEAGTQAEAGTFPRGGTAAARVRAHRGQALRGGVEGMIDDGARYVHDRTKRTPYDQVWQAIEGTEISMLGEHEFPGGRYRFTTPALGEIGWVSFTEGEKPEFDAGYWFGATIIAGRATTRRQALLDFIEQIHATHPGRAR